MTAATAASETDRDTLAMLLVSERQERPDAFLGALRAATKDLDTDTRDDAFLRWLASWDAETVAGALRLLRLAQST